MNSPTDLELALDQAIALHTGGELERAQEIYRDVLVLDELNARALHYLGIYLFQTGFHDEAIIHIRLSCELAPDNAEWLNDLGNVLFALNDFESAMASYQAALALCPEDHNIWNNLGSTQLNLGDRDAAIVAFKRAIEIMPEFGAALTNLGSVYEAMGDRLESSVYQCRAFVLPPHDGKSKQMLGICFYFLGRLREAAEIYRAWLDEEPGQPIAEHMYAACSQANVPQRASDGYVEEHFDKLAANFDVNLMENLSYGGPWLVNQAMTSIADAAKQFDILDVGCGTGLCAPRLASYAKHLVGVDLSGKMLDRAAALQLYDVLEKKEITQYLEACPSLFDVVVACDTLIYFGDLNRLFDGVARVLRSGGYFVFTTETIFDPDPSSTYQLHASGRYRHAETYIDAVLRVNGFMPVLTHRAKIREEVGVEVDGTLVVIQRL